LQKNHQSIVDLKFHLFVAKKLPKQKFEIQKNHQEIKVHQHVALTNCPGVFNQDILETLVTTETDDFQHSINLHDLDLMTTQKRLTQENNLSLEQKSEEENNEL